MVNQCWAFIGRELILGNDKAMSDTTISARDHQLRNVAANVVIPLIVDKVGNLVLNISLEHETSFAVVVEFIRTDFTINQLIHFVTLETVVTVGRNFE